jgi:WD40-like Beta Propeller Repeat
MLCKRDSQSAAAPARPPSPLTEGRRKASSLAKAIARLGVATAAALLAIAAPAAATFPGANGTLLLQGNTDFRPSGDDPTARPAECAGPGLLGEALADGTNHRNLGLGDSGTFSPDGQRLAISYAGACGGPDRSAGLYIARADGTHRHRIAGDALIGWMPSGQLIALQAKRHKASLIDALSGHRLVTLPGSDSDYATSTLEISCSGEIANIRGVYRQELDLMTPSLVHRKHTVRVRLSVHRLRMGATSISSTTFSPDGRSIVFDGSVGYPETGGLWTVGADGQGLRRLTNPLGGSDGGPIFSPDGQHIEFGRTFNFPNDNYTNEEIVANADGSNPQPVATLDGNPLPPFPVLEYPGTWSPDSTSIAFDGFAAGGIRLVATVDATTGTIAHAFNLGGYSVDDWQALPGAKGPLCAKRPTI